MSSLSSSMFAGYNMSNDAKVRIGSWREELAMKELTGVTRVANPRNKAVFNKTGVRVLYHSDKPELMDAGQGKSVSETSFVHPQKVPATKDRTAHFKPGPRAVRSQQKAKALVAAEEVEQEAFEKEKRLEGDFETVFRQSFKRHSNDASKAAKPEIIRPKSSSFLFEQTVPKALARNDISASCTNSAKARTEPEVEVGHYSTGSTVTLWNTEGRAPGGTGGKGTFGRKSRFTEPGVHPSFFQEVWPDPAPHHASLPTGLSDLEAASLMFLKRRVVERAQGKPLPSVRGLWRLLWPRTYRDAAEKIDPREFREGMAEFEVPVTQCEVWAVTAAFDTDGSGQICLDKLIHFFRAGGFSETRRKMVHRLFEGLDAANCGAVSLDRLRAACNFSALPAVTKGKVSEDEVAAAFLHHFNPGDERLHDAIMVPVEQFQEAFRDVGTACIPVKMCSWKIPGPEDHANSKSVDLDIDADENDALFLSVVSAFG